MNKKQDIFFFFDVIIETTKADPAGLGDLPDGCGVESFGSEDLHGATTNLFLPLLYANGVFDFGFNHGWRGLSPEANDRSFGYC
jgi:hypothetical protein